MKKEEYNNYRYIRSNMRKWYDIRKESRYGATFAIECESTTADFRVKLDALYRSNNFYPYGIKTDKLYQDGKARIIYIAFDSYEEWERLTLKWERKAYEDALSESFNYAEFSSIKYGFNMTESESIETAESDETAKEDYEIYAESVFSVMEMSGKSYGFMRKAVKALSAILEREYPAII